MNGCTRRGVDAEDTGPYILPSVLRTHSKAGTYLGLEGSREQLLAGQTVSVKTVNVSLAPSRSGALLKAVSESSNPPWKD